MWCGKNEVTIDNSPVFFFICDNLFVIDIIFVHLCLSQDLNHQVGILHIYSNIHHHTQSTTHIKDRTSFR